MCKILVMPVVHPDKAELAWQVAKAMSKVMSRGNSDGLGYAAVDDEGKIFGERWLRNNEAFNERVEFTDLDRIMMDEFDGFLHKDERYNKFGELSEAKTRAIILHTRFATSGKGFRNTHPFVDDSTALIHNGVISNYTQAELKISSCDSEKILREYLKKDVANDAKKVQKMANALTGYYACAVLSQKRKDGVTILDVFKDQGANLGAAWVRELGAIVITTNPGDLIEVSKDLKLNIDSIYEIKPGVLMRFDVLAGRSLGATKFKPAGRSYYRGYTAGYQDVDAEYNNWRGYGNQGSWPETGGVRGKHGGTYYPPTGTQSTAVATVHGGDKVEAGSKDESKNNTATVLPLRMTPKEQADKDGWEYNSVTKTWKRTTP